MIPRTLAAVATVPGREAALSLCLESLRPQVEKLHVICHDMTDPPAAVRALADRWVCEPDRHGSAAGLRWSLTHQGLYLKCDDDWIYPPDYVGTMLRWVRRWRGRALVACHGRVLKRFATGFLDVDAAWSPMTEQKANWANYPGCCGVAWDTRLRVPAAVPGKNLEEPHLAVWAQRRRVPIFLLPHAADWLRYVLDDAAPGAPTIWRQAKASGFTERNRPIAEYSNRREWRVFRCR